jgi:hypothetical protein
MSSADEQLRLYSASAVWALVYDNQKATAAVKALVLAGQMSLTPTQPGAADEHAVLQAAKLVFAHGSN